MVLAYLNIVLMKKVFHSAFVRIQVLSSFFRPNTFFESLGKVKEKETERKEKK